MKILYVASEAAPFAASGGLADVIGSLPRAVSLASGAEVAVILPLYKCVAERFRDQLVPMLAGEVTLAWRRIPTRYYMIDDGCVKYYFVENEYYFSRQMLYGEYDDGERFAYFSRAVIAFMHLSGFVPDILHANDWQTALCVIYIKKHGERERLLSGVRCVYTIHNIDYQGVYESRLLWDIFDLDGGDYTTVDFAGMINLTKGAIVTADAITTVSKRYADELTEERFSGSLCGILREQREKLFGIVNGIDVDRYDPSKDLEIAARYRADRLEGKRVCRERLHELCGFSDNGDAIVAVVSRLASHKGIDLIERVLPELIDSGAKLALLGTGEEAHEEYFRRAEKRNGESVCSFIRFDSVLAKQIYAGADIFLMPSRSEPCGLAQLIASRYGTVPVVREVGGLYDTVKPYNYVSRTGDGFTFANYNAHEMLDAVMRAVLMRRDSPDEWTALINRIMQRDLSWDRSAREYIKLYRGLIAND